MKSILLHIYDDDGLEARLQAAFDMARAFGSHIICLHATPYEDYLATDPLVAIPLPEEFSEKMRKLRLELQDRIEVRLRTEGVSWDWVHVDALMSSALIRHSVLADLVVVSLGPAAVLRHDPRPLAAAVSIGGRAPVLAVPAQAKGLDFGRPAMLAWNGSPECAVAMRAALPVLQAAPLVHLLEVDDRASEYPRDFAARYLSRWDIGVDIVERPPIDGSASGAIRRAARELGSGVVVMGAYGHSRLREYVFGGVTRELTCNSAVPLLMSH
jgi:nucleotide-binding universal stress UspA family protein